MTLWRFVTVTICALAMQGCATDSAPEPAPSGALAAAAQAAAQPEAEGPDTVVCKRVKQTGTRFTSQQCLTRREWDLLQQGSREAVDEVQRRASHQQDMPGQ